MKKPLILLPVLVTLLLSGCGTSAQEKRNNFDKCVIEWIAEIRESDIEDYVNLKSHYDQEANEFCSHHLG